MAILSGNTELLDKAKIEKKITSLESERKAFYRSKSSSEFKLSEIHHFIDHNSEIIGKMTGDWDLFQKSLKQWGHLGENPVLLEGLPNSDFKLVGAKLNEIDDNMNTKGEYLKIGLLYDFLILVKSESSAKDGSIFSDNTFIDNRFFIQGQSEIKYTYNNGKIANDPKLASMNFINALQKIPELIEKYQERNEKLKQDVPVLQEVVDGKWRKEDQLKGLKKELSVLERKIQLSLEKQQNQLQAKTIDTESKMAEVAESVGRYKAKVCRL